MSLISSQYDKEAWQGCEIMLRLENDVHEALATAKERSFTEWNQRECNKSVGHHMGWLAEAQSRKTLLKTSGVPQAATESLKLTKDNVYKTVSKLTAGIAAAYKSLARDGALAVAVGMCRSFQDIRNAVHGQGYHKRWALRSVVQAVRKSVGARKLQLDAGTTVDEFTAVYPDESDYMESLACFYKTRNVKTILRHIGETGDPADFTMWLCFNGWLRPFNLEMSQEAEVKKQIKAHSMKYMGRTYLPHMSNTMEKVASALDCFLTHSRFTS